MTVTEKTPVWSTPPEGRVPQRCVVVAVIGEQLRVRDLSGREWTAPASKCPPIVSSGAGGDGLRAAQRETIAMADHHLRRAREIAGGKR